MSDDEQKEMTQEEQDAYLKALIGNTSSADEKHNVHTFLHAVATDKSTTRVGNLQDYEVGTPKLPLRTLKELGLFCKEIANMKEFGDYFDKKAEIMTATSLSKDAKLINLAVVQKREVSQRLKGTNVVNKGWFGKKKETKEEDL